MNRRRLERTLQRLEDFSDPDPAREQYPTPPDLAAHLLHLADLQGDLDRPVLDLGAGTGLLTVGAAIRGARAVGLELDRAALSVARENAARAGVTDATRWVRGDVRRLPLRTRADDGRTDGSPAAGESKTDGSTAATDPAAAPTPRWPAGGWTAVTNPPFGAQDGSVGDRPFLRAAADLATVSYSVHNAGSRSFLSSFVADRGGRVTHAFEAALTIDRQFPFHETDRETVDAEVFRVVWD